jgi:hypothetical protein
VCFAPSTLPCFEPENLSLDKLPIQISNMASQFVFILESLAISPIQSPLVRDLFSMSSMVGLSTEYVIKHAKDPEEATIFIADSEAGRLQRKGKEIFELTCDDEERWILNKKVDGRIAPFSIMATLESSSTPQDKKEHASFKIRNHLFRYNGNFYMIGIPEGKASSEFVRGAKYICRLVNFPFSDHYSIDSETITRLRRHRGIPVGKIYGLGVNGFHALIEPELEKIALPLAASCYLIYSSF